MTPASGVTPCKTAVTFIRSTAGPVTVDVALAWTSTAPRIDTSDLLEQFATDHPDPALIESVLSVARQTPGRVVRGDSGLDEPVSVLEAQRRRAPSEIVEIVWRPQLMRPPALPEGDETRAIVRWRLQGAADPSGGELPVPTISPCDLIEAFRVGSERRGGTARLQFRAELRGGELTIAWGTAAQIGTVDELLGLRPTLTDWERLARIAYESHLTVPGRQWSVAALARAAGVRRRTVPTEALDALFPGLLLLT
jgi:hypothetical protein